MSPWLRHLLAWSWLLGLLTITEGSLITRGGLLGGGKPCDTDDGNSGTCMEEEKCKTLDNQDEVYDCDDYTVCCIDPKKKHEVLQPRTTNTTNGTKCICGLRPHVKDRVVGGNESTPFSWPWMIAILYRRQQSQPKELKCGGTVITPDCVLSSAHCFFGNRSIVNGEPHAKALYKNHERFTILVGAHNITEAGRKSATELKTKKIIIHEKFKYGVAYYDLAIMYIDGNLYDVRGVPICHSNPPKLSYEQLSKKKLVVTGWGATEPGGKANTLLFEVNVTLQERKNCETNYMNNVEIKHVFPKGVTQDLLCAGGKKGANKEKDSCKGDSGGPLLLENAPNHWFQVGIVTMGARCGDVNFPGLYTNLSHYLDWITQKKNLTV